MGQRRRTIGRLHKNFEKKRQALKANKPGRPRKHLPPTLNGLKSSVVLPSAEWSARESEDNLHFLKIKEQPNPNQPVIVTHCLAVKKDFTWQVSVHGHTISSDCSPLSAIPKHLTKKSTQELLTTLDTASVCAGHPDKHLLEFVKAKKGNVLSKSGKVMATIDANAPIFLNGERYLETVRPLSCTVLVHGVKCSSCTAYRDTLRAMYHQWHKKGNASRCGLSNSHTNTRYLNSPEKIQRLSEWKARAKAAEIKVRRLQEKIAVATEKDGVEVDEDLHSDLAQIMGERSSEVQDKHDSDSFQRVFWEQQLQAHQAASPKQYRWHPMMIRWCLHLHMLSSSAYDAVRSSGVITLPSQRTLRDYTRWIKSGVGIQPEVTAQLVQEAQKSTNVKELRAYAAVVFDEMKVKEGIVYDKHNCQVVGFVNLSDANNQLMAFQRQLESGKENPSVAKQILVFMVRGIFTKLTFPYAQFPTTGITAELLYPLLWDVIRHLECAGFKVITVTGDKAAPNRRLFRMHYSKSSPPDTVVHKVLNPYSEDKRFIYLFSDVPHLIKTVRNCWSNSFGHSHKRSLWVRKALQFCYVMHI